MELDGKPLLVQSFRYLYTTVNMSPLCENPHKVQLLVVNRGYGYVGTTIMYMDLTT